MGDSIEKFPIFYHDWNQRLRALLDQLLDLPSPPPHDGGGNDKNRKRPRLTNDEEVTNQTRRHVIDQVLHHYQVMYEEKSKVADIDVFMVLSPPWFTRFEKTMLWLSWFKPSVVFPIAADSVGETLTEEQRQRMEKAKAEIRRYETDLEKEFARLQETVAGSPVYEMMRGRRRSLVVVSELISTEEEFKVSLRAVINYADDVRMAAVKRVMEILNMEQAVKFLTHSNRHQLQLRKLGLQREASFYLSN